MDEGPSVRELYTIEGSGSENVRSQEPNAPQPADTESLSSSASSLSSSGIRLKSLASLEYPTEAPQDVGTVTPLPLHYNRHPDFETSMLISLLSPSAYQAQLLSAFMNTISSATGPINSPGPAFHGHGVWLSEIANRSDISPTLVWAIRTISLSHLGRVIQDRGVIEHSRRFYGKTLSRLSKALQDPVEGLSSDTLSATVLLSFYELLTCTERHSWIRHAGGAGNLIRIRGPERHRTGFDRTVFLACRINIIMEALQVGKPCFLDLPPWRKLCRSIREEDLGMQTPFHFAKEDIFQEIVKFPGYIHETVMYMSRKGDDISVLEHFIDQGTTHRSNYKACQARLMVALESSGSEPTKAASSSNDRLFPVVYRFPDIVIASLCCGYWSMLSILNITLIGLEARISDLQTQQHQQESVPRYATNFLTRPYAQYTRPNKSPATASRSLPHRASPQRTPRQGNEEFGSRTQDVRRGSMSPLPSQSPQNIPKPGGVGTQRRWNAADTAQYQTPTGPQLGVRQHHTSSKSGEIWSAVSDTQRSPSPSFATTEVGSRRSKYLAENIINSREICKAVEFMTSSTFMAPLFLVFGLRVAIRILDKEEEKTWIMNKLLNISKSFGLAKTEADIYVEQQQKLRTQR